MGKLVLVRGGGDLATGAVIRLVRAGFQVVVSELEQPLAVRRSVSFAETVYQREWTIEGHIGVLAGSLEESRSILRSGRIPVMVDPDATLRHALHPDIIIDGRMTKRPPDLGLDAAELVIGLGPCFVAGLNCHAAIETKRGFTLGRVYWKGTAEADSGVPETVGSHESDRVLRAPADGIFQTDHQIGDWVEKGTTIARVGGLPCTAAFSGLLRGLLHPGLQVKKGLKVGDIDPRNDPRLCQLISDKALAVGGGVLEVICTRYPPG